jgi:hypothetical protein
MFDTQPQPTCWRPGCASAYPLVGEAMGDDLLVVARGLPSETFSALLDGPDATTWFTVWAAAVEDSWWVVEEGEQAYIEVGTVRLADARDVRNGFATIEVGLVDAHALLSVDPPTEREWSRSVAKTQLAVIGNAELSSRYDELDELRRQLEDESDDY